LSTPEISSYRVVLQPEKIVIREAERAISYLGLFNYPVDSIMVNRVLPESAQEGEFFRQRRQLQQSNIEKIENNFRPLPIWYKPYYSGEVIGFESLSKLGVGCFGDRDPGQVFYHGILQEIETFEDGRCQLRLPLPFVKKAEVRLRKRGDELFITIGSFKREMILPSALAKYKPDGGRLKNATLEIDFVPSETVVTN